MPRGYGRNSPLRDFQYSFDSQHSGEDILKEVELHSKLVIGFKGEEIGVRELRKHIAQLSYVNKDCILFYRLGDFYEMFFEDALTVTKELDITLTGKSCGLEERAPMCGVPYHAVEGYLNRLVQKGYKVAICEQVEDPKLAKGIVKREVVRIVTPGTNLNIQALDESKNNYIMCIVYIGDHFGLAVADVTTGDYFVTELDNTRKLLDEIAKFAPNFKL